MKKPEAKNLVTLSFKKRNIIFVMRCRDRCQNVSHPKRKFILWTAAKNVKYTKSRSYTDFKKWRRCTVSTPISTEKQCCGSGSGIRCLYDHRSGVFPDPKSIFLRA
jgi:hypothetical protein